MLRFKSLLYELCCGRGRAAVIFACSSVIIRIRVAKMRRVGQSRIKIFDPSTTTSVKNSQFCQTRKIVS